MRLLRSLKDSSKRPLERDLILAVEKISNVYYGDFNISAKHQGVLKEEFKDCLDLIRTNVVDSEKVVDAVVNVIERDVPPTYSQKEVNAYNDLIDLVMVHIQNKITIREFKRIVGKKYFEGMNALRKFPR